MSIEEIKERLERFDPGKVVKYNPNDPLSLKPLLDETIKDARFLLERNQRLEEALEQIKYEYEQGSDDKVAYRMYKEARDAYKLLEKKD